MCWEFCQFECWLKAPLPSFSPAAQDGSFTKMENTTLSLSLSLSSQSGSLFAFFSVYKDVPSHIHSLSLTRTWSKGIPTLLMLKPQRQSPWWVIYRGRMGVVSCECVSGAILSKQCQHPKCVCGKSVQTTCEVKNTDDRMEKACLYLLKNRCYYRAS